MRGASHDGAPLALSNLGTVRKLAVLVALLVPASCASAQEPSEPAVERRVVYTKARSFSGRTLSLRLDLHRPASRGRHPAIVWIHGGGFTGGRRQDMDGYAAALADRGYVAATISYRLATRAQRRRGADVVGAVRSDGQAAVRFLRRRARRYGVDARRVFVGGYSAGAVGALRIAHHPRGRSSRVRGAVSIAGSADRSLIGRGDAPVLWFHGTRDRVVSYGAARSACSLARRRGGGCSLVTLGGGHEIVATRFSRIVSATTRWLRRR